jgi:hypothetical protein
VKLDKAKAAQLYGQAAEQGHGQAQYDLGRCYARGEGVKVDKAKAAQLLGQVAEQGLAEAQHALGTCYANGQGVNVDAAKVAQLYGQAAEQGNARAQLAFGVCYHFGQGVEVDKDKAAQLYGQAAGQGHADAQSFLGLCYEHGRGVPHDMGAAVALYQQAIEGGLLQVIASLGLCFEKGRGVLQSTAEAEGLYKLAAKSGSSTLDALPGGLGKLLKESLVANATPDTPSAVARARIQFAVYSLNLAARQGHAAADEQLKLLTGRRHVVSASGSACCVGCGAVRQPKSKTCVKCRIARLCDKECTARMWPAHKASCKAWRAEFAAGAEQS